MQTETLRGGFSNPALQSAAVFRGVMEAMARPGMLQSVQGAMPPAPLSEAAGAVLLTLCDRETPLHLAQGFDTPDLRSWIAFHTGAPIVGPSHCQFALGYWDNLMPLSNYQVGTSEYPDRSATLIVEMPDLTQSGATLKGPGIKSKASLSLPCITPFQENAAQFPLGVDFIFTCGETLAALPRTTEIF